MENWSSPKMKAIELFSEGTYNNKQVAELVDVCPNTITEWRKDPLFMDDIIELSRSLLRGRLAPIYNKLAVKAENGSYQHIKLLLEHLDNLEEHKSKNADKVITFVWNESDS